MTASMIPRPIGRRFYCSITGCNHYGRYATVPPHAREALSYLTVADRTARALRRRPGAIDAARGRPPQVVRGTAHLYTAQEDHPASPRGWRRPGHRWLRSRGQGTGAGPCGIDDQRDAHGELVRIQVHSVSSHRHFERLPISSGVSRKAHSLPETTGDLYH